MSVRCTPVVAPEAIGALAGAVRDAKQGNPLAPVTVIVPTNAVGVAARRSLGADGGVAAIDLVTPGRLAERIAGAELAATGRRPVSTPLIDITVREVLRHAPGHYATVADHPSTVTSLRDLHRELRMAGPVAAAALRGASGRGSEAARVSSMVSERLAGHWYDEADLITLAIERVRSGGPPFERAVAFLPRIDRGLPADLLRSVGDTIDLHVLVEWTGIASVDDETAEFAAALGAPVEPAGDPVPPVPTDTRVVSTTDADEEVRHAVRQIIDAARGGVPFARMALVWPTDRPYARLVEHHLGIAGLPWNGRPGTLVTERLVPRFLIDLLDLDRRGLRRTELFDLLADVPINDGDGNRVSVAAWERRARAAGVSTDAHWAPRLASHAAAMRATERERLADDAEALSTFVEALRRDLGPRSRTRSWGDWADWCERQVLFRLGRSVLDQLDEAERLASDHASRVLDRLRYLDTVSEPVSRGEFRSAFAAEFEAAPGRLGRLGEGVSIGSLSGTVGLGADLTIVLGAADGLLPPPPPSDPLISDADRRAAGLASSDARANRIHRSFLSHATTSDALVVHTPRGDLRATTDRLASRWVAEHLAEADRSTVASHHAGLVACAFPGSAPEHRLRSRAVAAAGGTDELVAACAGDVAAVRGLRLRAGRRSDVLTEYDGDLSGVAIDHFPQAVSASQIELWPSCPLAYYMRYLLGVRPIDDPADELGLSPMERGNVIHEALDVFHQRVIAGEVPQPDEAGWSSQAVATLEQIFAETADRFERTGRTGRAANWFLQRPAVRAELLNWFLEDGRLAAARGARIIHSELHFGGRSGIEVALPLGGERSLAVRGAADRIDLTAGGELVIVDHKTGKADAFKKIDRSDPTEGRTKFQLPIYAAAALAAVGEPPESSVAVRAEYGFFDRGGYRRYGYSFDPEVWSQVTDDLRWVVAGIESGLFPAVTGPPKFRFFNDNLYVDPDDLGVDERYDEWARKQHDPRLAPWFGAADPDEGDDR